MTPRTTALLLSTIAFALACGSGDPPKPAATEDLTLVSENPQCCVDRSVDPRRYRVDVDRAGCQALGGNSLWMASTDCVPVCCVKDGKSARLLVGECAMGGAPADDAACATEGASACCVVGGSHLPANDPACGPGGSGTKVVGPACDSVCCTYEDAHVAMLARGECSGRVEERDPCVADQPACCRASCDTTGGTEIHVAWDPDGSCVETESLCDHEALDAKECEGIAVGDKKSSFVSDPDFKDGEYVGPGGEAAPPEDLSDMRDPADPADGPVLVPSGDSRARPLSERPRPASEGKPRPR